MISRNEIADLFRATTDAAETLGNTHDLEWSAIETPLYTYGSGDPVVTGVVLVVVVGQGKSPNHGYIFPPLAEDIAKMSLPKE